MTTGPDGQRMSIEQRLADIRARYDPSHRVSRALARSEPISLRLPSRVARKLSARTAIPRPVTVASALAF
jgi:hypothetical protein